MALWRTLYWFVGARASTLVFGLWLWNFCESCPRAFNTCLFLVFWFTCTCAAESKGDHLEASNQVQLVNSNCGKLNEEAIVHQLEDVMAIVQSTPETGKTTMEEAASRHAFC
jgi:hypothetical protein